MAFLIFLQRSAHSWWMTFELFSVNGMMGFSLAFSDSWFWMLLAFIHSHSHSRCVFLQTPFSLEMLISFYIMLQKLHARVWRQGTSLQTCQCKTLSQFVTWKDLAQFVHVKLVHRGPKGQEQIIVIKFRRHVWISSLRISPSACQLKVSSFWSKRLWCLFPAAAFKKTFVIM